MPEHRWTRREFLRAAGGAAGMVTLSQVLAACGVAGAQDAGFRAEPSGLVNVANWGWYLDREGGAETGPGPRRPSLERFTEETGIKVNYREVISDSAIFYSQIEPFLAAGRPTGWDIMVMTNGLTLTKLIDLGYLEPLPADLRPTFDEHASELVKDPSYDPGGRFSMAWQSGITGIAYNPAFTGRPITSMRDLFSDEFAGKVGMFGDPVDLPNFALLALGIDPETSTPDDWAAAAQLLREQRDGGILRGYYAQAYIRALENGEVAATMAWSGDIFQLNASGDPNGIQFVVPEEGALLWTDAMCVPKHAEHPADAIKLMDFVYRPDIAAMIAAYVNYITPVPAAQDELLRMADDEEDATEAARLRQVAQSPLVFPSEADRDRLRTYRELGSSDELAQWDETFREFYL
jgi:spermidine/putrescine transport system substrate-binding protein